VPSVSKNWRETKAVARVTGPDGSTTGSNRSPCAATPADPTGAADSSAVSSDAVSREDDPVQASRTSRSRCATPGISPKTSVLTSEKTDTQTAIPSDSDTTTAAT
jgi:hypothetical protein